MTGQQIYGYDASEHEYAVEVPPIMAGAGEISLYLSAHGGGTVGKAYAGNGWDYLVVADGRTVLEGSDLRSPQGRPAGHAEMARALASFLSAAGESFALRGEASEYAGDSSREAEYSAAEAEWLAAEYERLGMFAAEDSTP